MTFRNIYKKATRTQRENKDIPTRINAAEKMQTTEVDADQEVNTEKVQSMAPKTFEATQ
jgi:hypothetical protein